MGTLDDAEVQALASIRHKLNGGGEVEGFMFNPGMQVSPIAGAARIEQNPGQKVSFPSAAALGADSGGIVW